MAQEGGRNWYRQVSVFSPKGTPSREEHKTPGRVLTTFFGALTNWCRKIRQNVSPQEHSKYQGSQRRCSYGITLQRIATRWIKSFFYFTTLLNLTKAGIAFSRHAPPIVKYLRRRCAYGDTVNFFFNPDFQSQRHCTYAIDTSAVVVSHMVDYQFGGFFCILQP